MNSSKKSVHLSICSMYCMYFYIHYINLMFVDGLVMQDECKKIYNSCSSNWQLLLPNTLPSGRMHFIDIFAYSSQPKALKELDQQSVPCMRTKNSMSARGHNLWNHSIQYVVHFYEAYHTRARSDIYGEITPYGMLCQAMLWPEASTYGFWQRARHCLLVYVVI